MYFGFALDLSYIDLLNIDLLHERYTHLDLLDTDIPSKHFVCLQNELKTSSRYVFQTSSRHVLKTSSRRLENQKMFAGFFHWQLDHLLGNGFRQGKTSFPKIGIVASNEKFLYMVQVFHFALVTDLFN